MTEVNLNETIDGYRGAIGNLVFKKYKGRTIVCRKPKSTKPPSPLQIAERARFKEAVEYAKAVKADPAARAFYEPIARERDTSVYWLAIRDFRCLPSIKPLDLSNYKGQVGNQIYFVATDSVGVTGAWVTISDTEGNPFESGSATQIDPKAGLWMYTTLSVVPAGTYVLIKVQVNDRAGNITEVTEEKAP